MCTDNCVTIYDYRDYFEIRDWHAFRYTCSLVSEVAEKTVHRNSKSILIKPVYSCRTILTE
jgi:hypothetical protein